MKGTSRTVLRIQKLLYYLCLTVVVFGCQKDAVTNPAGNSGSNSVLRVVTHNNLTIDLEMGSVKWSSNVGPSQYSTVVFWLSTCSNSTVSTQEILSLSNIRYNSCDDGTRCEFCPTWIGTLGAQGKNEDATLDGWYGLEGKRVDNGILEQVPFTTIASVRKL